MRLQLLKVGQKINSTIFSLDIIEKIVENFKCEIIGQVINGNEDILINPNKISHIVKKLQLNRITSFLECEIEFIQKPYGEQLYLYHKRKNKINWIPIIDVANSKLLTINAKLINEKI